MYCCDTSVIHLSLTSVVLLCCTQAAPTYERRDPLYRSTSNPISKTETRYPREPTSLNVRIPCRYFIFYEVLRTYHTLLCALLRKTCVHIIRCPSFVRFILLLLLPPLLPTDSLGVEKVLRGCGSGLHCARPCDG